MNTDFTNKQKAEQEEEKLTRAVEELSKEELPNANIMVAGITGVGKSTLLNAIFGDEVAKTGKGMPVTDRITKYKDNTKPITIWDTVGLELDPEKRNQSIGDMKNVIAQKADSEDLFDRIHAIWYCINSGGGWKYQSAELDFIRELHSTGVPFIVVVTQCISDEDEINDFVKIIRDINSKEGMADIEVVSVLAKEYTLKGGVRIPPFGLESLVDITLGRLPEFLKKGFIAAQTVNRNLKRNECEEIIAKYIRESKQGFWDKVPIANIFAANSRILGMFKEIGFMYDYRIPRDTISKIADRCRLDAENVFFGLIAPMNNGYSKKVNDLLESKKLDGFKGDIGELEKRERVALMIAYYGYIFISAIEGTWEKLTEEQLKDIDMVCDTLVRLINEKLKGNKENGSV